MQKSDSFFLNFARAIELVETPSSKGGIDPFTLGIWFYLAYRANEDGRFDEFSPKAIAKALNVRNKERAEIAVRRLRKLGLIEWDESTTHHTTRTIWVVTKRDRRKGRKASSTPAPDSIEAIANRLKVLPAVETPTVVESSAPVQTPAPKVEDIEKNVDSTDNPQLSKLLNRVGDRLPHNQALQTLLGEALQTYGFERVERSIAYTHAKNPANYLRYLQSTVKNDYGKQWWEKQHQQSQSVEEAREVNSSADHEQQAITPRFEHEASEGHQHWQQCRQRAVEMVEKGQEEAWDYIPGLLDAHGWTEEEFNEGQLPVSASDFQEYLKDYICEQLLKAPQEG